MLFNSIEYLFFLPIVFIVYWLLNRYLKYQNLFLLCASYFFYGIWDYRFLLLIIVSSFVDFVIGQKIYASNSQIKRKWLLFASLTVNLGFLLAFKYFNFFVESFITLLTQFNVAPSVSTLQIILPVGISFYTFQTLSYTIDIYKKKFVPTKSLLNFFTFVAFFPQLVAGPIERAANLLPQIEQKRSFDYAKGKDGLRQILWGLFKKVVIADNCAVYVDTIFAQHHSLTGLILVIGAVLFTFQVYCDFSGYSDIAIGTAKLFGVDLMQNFSTPMFSTNISDLWRRWHISLSTWFRDYIFNPLSFRLRNLDMMGLYLTTFLTFSLIGFWHGGNWTFIVFGLLQAIVLNFEAFTMKLRRRFRKKNPFKKLYYFFSWLITMVFWIFSCLIFRSDSISDVLVYLDNMFIHQFIRVARDLKFLDLEQEGLILLVIYIFVLLVIEWVNRNYKHALERLPTSVAIRFGTYIVLCVLVLEYFSEENSFIYFQF